MPEEEWKRNIPGGWNRQSLVAAYSPQSTVLPRRATVKSWPQESREVRYQVPQGPGDGSNDGLVLAVLKARAEILGSLRHSRRLFTSWIPTFMGFPPDCESEA